MDEYSTVVQFLINLVCNVSGNCSPTKKKQPNTCNHSQDVLQFKLLGTLGSHNSDDNANTTKAIGLISKTTILQVHLPFFVHFFAVTARLQRENA